MNDATSPFAFSQFVPGFDFLKNLASGAAAPTGTAAGMPSLSNWVAPTLSVEELDKRIQELKTVQYWLEQNGHALKATIQALEVQKMTLSTLRGMNVQMEDLAKAFTRSAGGAAAEPSAANPWTATASSTAPGGRPTEAEAPSAQADGQRPSATADEGEGAADEGSAAQGAEPTGAAPGVVDPLQWWNALTQQFQHIAETAMQDAAQMKMPGAGATPEAPARQGAAKKTVAKSTAAAKTAAKKSAAKKMPAEGTRSTPRKSAAAPRAGSR